MKLTQADIGRVTQKKDWNAVRLSMLNMSLEDRLTTLEEWFDKGAPTADGFESNAVDRQIQVQHYLNVLARKQIEPFNLPPDTFRFKHLVRRRKT